MNRWIVGVAGPVAAVALSVAGCSDDDSGQVAASTPPPASSTAPSAVAPAEFPDGWQQFEATAYLVTFGAPQGWIDIDPGSADLEAGLEALGLKDNEAMARIIDQVAGNPDLFFVVDTESLQTRGGNFATNINLVCFDAAGVGSVSDLENAVRISNTQLGAENLETIQATISGRDAVRVSYDLPTPNVKISGRQYHWLTEDGQGCSFTLSTDRPDDYEELFEQIVQTVRIG